MPSDWLAIVRQTYRKYLAGAGQSMSAFRTSLLPLTSRPSPLTFRPRLSPSQFAPRSFPLADRPSQFAPRSFSLAPQCPSRNSIVLTSHCNLPKLLMIKLWTGHVSVSAQLCESRMHHSLTEIKHFGVMPLRFGVNCLSFWSS